MAKLPLGQTFTVKLTVQFPELFICSEMVGIVVIPDALFGENKTCGDSKFGGYCTECSFSTSVENDFAGAPPLRILQAACFC